VPRSGWRSPAGNADWGPADSPGLETRDRDERHLVELAQQRLEVGRMNQPVQRRDVGAGISSQDREVKKIAVEMQKIEAIAVAEHQLHQPDMMQQGLTAFWIAPECARAGRHELGRGLRVAAGEECHLVALPDELLGQVGDARSVPPYMSGGTLSLSGATCAMRMKTTRSAGDRSSQPKTPSFYLVAGRLAICLPRARIDWVSCKRAGR